MLRRRLSSRRQRLVFGGDVCGRVFDLDHEQPEGYVRPHEARRHRSGCFQRVRSSRLGETGGGLRPVLPPAHEPDGGAAARCSLGDGRNARARHRHRPGLCRRGSGSSWSTRSLGRTSPKRWSRWRDGSIRMSTSGRRMRMPFLSKTRLSTPSSATSSSSTWGALNRRRRSSCGFSFRAAGSR